MDKQQTYSTQSKEYEKSLTNDQRSDNGIFYTEVDLAEKIILDLNIPKDALIIDPCCGVGSFLCAANNLGHINVYGADNDSNAVTICETHFPGIKLIVADSIGFPAQSIIEKFELTDRFDYVIGNPPYAPLGNGVEIFTPQNDITFINTVNSYGKNLFIGALIRSLEFAREGGIVSYIIPKNFLHVSTYNKFRKYLLNEKTIVSIVDLGICFKDVRGEQIVLTIKNSLPDEKNKIKLQKYEKKKFITIPLKVPQSFYVDEIILFSRKEDFEIYKFLCTHYLTLKDMDEIHIARGKSISLDAIKGKHIRKFGLKTLSLPNKGSRIFIQNIYSTESGIIASFGGNLEASQTVTVLTDGDSRTCRYILGILHSRICNFFLYKYCYNSSRLTMHTDAKYLKKLPLPFKTEESFNNILNIVLSLENEEYMTEKWFYAIEELNKLIYKIYGISNEHAQYIDDEMQETQSKRWSQ